jgi:hypothetical protein
MIKIAYSPKYRLKRLSDREKYDRGKLTKSAMSETRKRSNKYNPTFRLVSKNRIFLHKCMMTCRRISFIELASAVGFVPV